MISGNGARASDSADTSSISGAGTVHAHSSGASSEAKSVACAGVAMLAGGSATGFLGVEAPASSCNGTTLRSSRRASADRRKGWACQPSKWPSAMSSAQRSKARKASPDNCNKGGCMGFCSASQALSNCSIDQAASPNSLSPTMRELPLRV